MSDISSDIKDLGDVANAPVSTSMGIAAIALQMAMRYHDITVVKDGALYQQYKLEGKNMQDLHIDVVFETAMQIEMHLLTRERAISEMIAQTIIDGIDSDSPMNESVSSETETQ